VADQPSHGARKHGSHEQWATRIGVILAVAGSAVGLGNFLRFPGIAVQNGGGAFMLPYFISLLVLGIPLCWAEWTMGRYGGLRGFNSAPGIYSMLWPHRAAKYLGAVALLIPLVIYMYYVLLESWCLGYALQYLIGNEDLVSEGADYGAFFNGYVGSDADGAMFTPEMATTMMVLVGTFTLNFVLIYRGISKGIETFCRYAMPLMVVLALIVLIRVLTLGTPDPSLPDQSVLGGLGFMWNPDFSKLTQGETWLAASGQIFFSLSVGFGIIINYASYLKRDDDVVLSGLTSSSMNEFFEVCLGGLITVPAAFIFLGAAAGEHGTFGLGFVALPNVFAQMPGGRLFGCLWFFMLFIAAITSSVSMLQPVIAFLEEGFGLKRHASAAILGLISALGCGFVLYFSKGTIALDMFDFWVGSVMLFILALAQAILYGWAFGIERGEQEAHVGAHFRIPRFVQYMLKYVVPVYLIIIFGGFVYQDVLSHNDTAATLPATLATSLENGQIGPELAAALAENELTVSDAVTIEPADDGNRWQAFTTDDEGNPLLATTFVRSDEGLEVRPHQPGYVEKIGRSRTAVLSVSFIGVIFVFILLLINIAGRRWEAQGRLVYDR
jgi:SNF family Na+-dependent transporter